MIRLEKLKQKRGEKVQQVLLLLVLECWGSDEFVYWWKNNAKFKRGFSQTIITEQNNHLWFPKEQFLK